MADNTCQPVSVSRKIDVPADKLFDFLARPVNHPLIDGSGMLREGRDRVVTGVGDVFAMKMHNDEMGDYEMLNHVVEYEPNRRISWEPVLKAASRAEDQADIGDRSEHRWTYELTPLDPSSTKVTETYDCSRAPEWLRSAVKGGTRWIDSMTVTLERLHALSLEGGALTAGGQYKPITVSRRIGAPASVIFQVLADPRRHRDLDGSGMLRGVASGTTISGVGDVFVMKMYFAELGDYEMNNHVVEYEPDRRLGWEPEAGRGHPNADPQAARQARWGQRWSFELTPDGPDATTVTEIFDCSRVPEDERVDIDNGNIWLESMTRTLQRLDGLCARQPGAAATPD